jgi:hypothetical protein
MDVSVSIAGVSGLGRSHAAWPFSFPQGASGFGIAHIQAEQILLTLTHASGIGQAHALIPASYQQAINGISASGQVGSISFSVFSKSPAGIGLGIAHALVGSLMQQLGPGPGIGHAGLEVARSAALISGSYGIGFAGVLGTGSQVFSAYGAGFAGQIKLTTSGIPLAGIGIGHAAIGALANAVLVWRVFGTGHAGHITNTFQAKSQVPVLTFRAEGAVGFAPSQVVCANRIWTLRHDPPFAGSFSPAAGHAPPLKATL